MNYMQIEKTSVANGKGIRTVLWVSGCSLHCKGCQNPETWDFKAGKPFDEKAKDELFEALDKPYIKGLTISGGNPLEFENQIALYNLLTEYKNRFPQKDVWLYTGFTFNEQVFELDDFYIYKQILKMCDVIVDGEFIQEQRDITLPFRGSSNQRLIDVKQTLNNKKIVLLKI